MENKSSGGRWAKIGCAALCISAPLVAAVVAKGCGAPWAVAAFMGHLCWIVALAVAPAIAHWSLREVVKCALLSLYPLEVFLGFLYITQVATLGFPEAKASGY